MNNPVDAKFDHKIKRALAIYLWQHLDSCCATVARLLSANDMQEVETMWSHLQVQHALASMNIAIQEGDCIECECQMHGKVLLCPGDKSYPSKLYDMASAPILCVRGDVNVLKSSQIAMVGSRKTTETARRITPIIADDVMARGFIVTSGGAFGIDALSHRQAMKRSQPTIVVSATGVDKVSPKENADIFDYAMQCGAVVSQYPRPPKGHLPNFPERNDVIAALSQATIVVQSRIKGGALYTAQAARRFGRPVYVAAMPGFDELTEGGWQLVKAQKAQLLSDKSDLDGIVPDIQQKLPFDIPKESGICASNAETEELSETKKRILAILANSTMTREQLRSVTGDANDFDDAMLELELGEMIQFVAGRYCKP